MLRNNPTLKSKKAIPKIYRSRRRFEDALTWVEQGLEIARSDSRRSVGERVYCAFCMRIVNAGKSTLARKIRKQLRETHSIPPLGVEPMSDMTGQ